MMRRPLAFLFPAFLLFPNVCLPSEPSQEPYRASVPIMGTVGQVQIWGLDAAGAWALSRQIFARWRDVDSAMSLYKPSSDLVRLNHHAGGGPVTVCPDMIEILQQAQGYRATTHGLFDVRVGALMDLWGLGATRRTKLPSPAEIRDASKCLRDAAIRVSPALHQAQISEAGAKIDLGGIAKGYALDKACELVRAAGGARAVLDLGGQLMLYRPPAEGWQIGVREPGNSEGIVGTLTIRRTCSIATSSQQDRFRKTGRNRLGHIVNPRTGKPAPRLGSVCVIAGSATQADVLSTALLLASEAETPAIAANFRNAQFLRITPYGTDGWKFRASEGLRKAFASQGSSGAL